jgi:hypothetical protein
MKQRARFEIAAAQTAIAFLASAPAGAPAPGMCQSDGHSETPLEERVAPAMASSWKLRAGFEKAMRRVFSRREAVRCACMAAACALLLAPGGIGRAQEVFSSSYSSETVTDSFSASCISAQKPNIWKQLGVNPLTCGTQSMGQDASGQCTLKGATVVAHQGSTCYYCVPINPPGQIYIPYDQVENASVRGYLCGTSPVDPGCMAICSQEFPNTTTTVPPSTGGGGGPSTQKVPETTGSNYYPIDTSTTSWNQPCQPAPPDQPPGAPYVRYEAGFQAGFNDCKVTPTIVGDVAAAAFGSVYDAIPSTLEISTSAKTLQSVIHPAGASANANPYLEGETDGGRLCAWLLKNDAGRVTECPGKTPVLVAQVPQTTSKSPVTQPCKKQTGTATADDLVTALYKFYRSQQFTKWGAAYMVGSLLRESGLDPAVNESGGGHGYGLGQWTNVAPFTSYTALQCYAQAHGTPVSDFVTQAHFSVQQRPDITGLFKTAQNAQQAQDAVTKFENYEILGDRFVWGDAICKNVVCTQEPPSKFSDDPKVGVPAGKGLGVNVSKALGSGANFSNLIQSLQCSWAEPADLKASMDACMKKASPKKP